MVARIYVELAGRTFRILPRLTLLASILCVAGPTPAEPPSARSVAARTGPAVVSILARNEWGEQIGSGSGFFVDDHGTFVTNYHVLEGASTLTVEMQSGERYNLVYTVVLDAERDLAIMAVPAEQTPFVGLGSDQALEVGDTVYVMGNPLGLDRTFSNGLVSARRVVDGSEVIQITAPISPGSSGGPVMDEQGGVIGIATWYAEGGQNLNMAIPVRYVRPLLAMTHTPTPFEGRHSVTSALVAPEVRQPSRRRAARIDQNIGDRWNQQVLAQLAAFENAALGAGVIRSHEPVTGMLPAGESGVITIKLEQGREYLFVGACDQDCTDIDLFLYDADNELVASQEEVTDVPMLTHTIAASGEHTLRVRMYACSIEPCAFGVVTFRER